MISIIKKDNCCGCRACVNICPVNCIAFEYDEEGFGYPRVDETQCIKCGMCEKTCPFIGEHESNDQIEIYGAWCRDEEKRFSSASGGIFAVLAETIIKCGGIVFGVKVDENGCIVHSSAVSEEGIKAFRKSKYVQSDVGFTYREAKEYLDRGKRVLFSGTPCQILALHEFLGKPYDNLYTIDVICVGVSSPGVWKSYIRQLEKEKGSKIKQVVFRNKEITDDILSNGERNLTIKVIFDNGESVYEYCDKNKMFDGFLQKLFLRPSCANCKAKNFKSGSDIQLGDFWDIESIYPEVLPLSKYKKRIPFGVSQVFVYTKKGQELFNQIMHEIVCFRADRLLVEQVQKNANWYLLKSSSQHHWNRELFFKEYRKDPDHVIEIMKDNLDIRDPDRISGKRIGIWGSFNLRQSIRLLSEKSDCKLSFQFRNSNIYSIMSEPGYEIECLEMSSNPLRKRMMKYDIEKEFRINIKSYAENSDYFIMDLLEERYDNFICGKTVITKSKGYFESLGIQGMPFYVSLEMWKETMKRFMALIEKTFSPAHIIVVENYLSYEYGKKFRIPKQPFENREYIDAVNMNLSDKYKYIEEQWPDIWMIPRVPAELAFTDSEHVYGCVPEHMNEGACLYIAQKIAEVISMREKNES